MTMTITMSIILSLNIMFTITTHPLASTILIIMQTLLICTMTGLLSYSFWFSYILFMIFLGGMLVLFIYITSLASNEMFNIPTKTMLMTMTSSTITLILMTNINIMNYTNHKNDILHNTSISYLSSELPMNMIQLYNMPTSILTIITIIYLLITLIIMVKITQIQEGPLRQSLN
uniref:NADH-ubiquinone oxidoreductase chain 6 n=1 Tax=Xenogryllus marmoratus TaxID=323499 RepID=A0A411LWL8_9ORTH|nr:NADH dehydrogenase subunit 6 [Xenogryllus marmoratus]QBF03787.1 NADH dehydrogenase subunit 6 [Xenogryllus marmoratus]